MPFLGQKAGGANHNIKQFTSMEKIDVGIYTGHPAARVRDADCRSSVADVSIVSVVSVVAVVAVLQIHHLPLASADCRPSVAGVVGVVGVAVLNPSIGP